MVNDGASLPGAAAVWRALASVADPEIPVVSIVDLGIVREVAWQDGSPLVTVTPTYSGCPATEVIMEDIARALRAAGFATPRVTVRLAPAWTTDWIAADARRRLSEYGIAPPGPRVAPAQVIDTLGLRRRAATPAVPCPRCASVRTHELSRFGSAACRAQYRCADCLEPFDYFKPH